MAGNKKISQLTAGGSYQNGDKFVIERGGVNFSGLYDDLDIAGISISGTVNDMIVVDEKGEVVLEKRITLPAPLSFVDNTAVPPSEIDGDIYLLDDTGASNAAWDGNPANTWVRFDGTAGLWKGIAPVDGYMITEQDTGDVRYFNPTTSTWDVLGGSPAGANTEIQYNNSGSFGASSLFTFNAAFGQFHCDASAVFNEGGTDQDFRIEGTTEANLFFVDASADSVGFKTNTPGAVVDIIPTSELGLRVLGSAAAAQQIVLINNNGALGKALQVTGSSDTTQPALGVTGGGSRAIEATATHATRAAIMGTSGTGKGIEGTVTGVGIGVEGSHQANGGTSLKARLLARGTGLFVNLEANLANSRAIYSVFEAAGQSETGATILNEFTRVARNGFGYTNDLVRINSTFSTGSVSGDNTGNILNVLKDGSSVFTIASQGEIGFFGATPVAQPSSTGETVGFTAGVGTGVNDDSTFTGNVGATAYRISDLVKHLKNLGLVAS